MVEKGPKSNISIKVVVAVLRDSLNFAGQPWDDRKMSVLLCKQTNVKLSANQNAAQIVNYARMRRRAEVRQVTRLVSK